MTYQTIVDIIASTTTKTGLKVQARIDKKNINKGIKVSKEKMEEIKIKKSSFHGEWNYTLILQMLFFNES